MSVSVDTVYKTTLLILNKEQRGYLTPDEFNKIGSQVQREIFERYFEDINQNVRAQQTDFDYANRVYNTDEKISEFKTEANLTQSAATNPPFDKYFSLPSDLYRLGSLTYSGGEHAIEIQKLTRNEYYNIAKSPLTKPSKSCPVYLQEDNKVMVFPNEDISSKISVQYVKKPEDIRWGYSVGSLGQYSFTNYPYVATAINIGDITSSISQNPTGFTSPSYTNLTTTVSPAGGTGATLDITATATGVTSATIVSHGSGYSAGDTLTVSQAQMAGANADLQIEITASDLFSGSQQGYIDFGLHNSERVELVINILFYAGVVIRDPQIVQTAMGQMQAESVNEKQ